MARREGDDLVLALGLDNFPMGWDYVELRSPDRLVPRPLFPRQDVGDIVVAQVTAPGG